MPSQEQKLRAAFNVAGTDEERRLVLGWAVITHDENGMPIKDDDGHVVDLQSLQEALWDALKNGGAGMGDEMHEREGVSDIVEVLTMSPEDREALGFGKGPAGAIVRMRVTDDGAWARVKSGDLAELSITGTATDGGEADA